MIEMTEDIGDFVRKGIAAQGAADQAAGRLTASDSDHEAIIGELRDSLSEELSSAIDSARRAARTLAELAGPVYDAEYAETERGSDLAALIDTARRQLTAARAQLVP